MGRGWSTFRRGKAFRLSLMAACVAGMCVAGGCGLLQSRVTLSGDASAVGAEVLVDRKRCGEMAVDIYKGPPVIADKEGYVGLGGEGAPGDTLVRQDDTLATCDLVVAIGWHDMECRGVHGNTARRRVFVGAECLLYVSPRRHLIVDALRDTVKPRPRVRR